MRRPRCVIAVLALLAIIGVDSARAAPPTVSVGAAANFIPALAALHAAFQPSSPGVVLRTTTAATGSLFAQIQNGAPFDVLLSADTEYPARLVAAGHGDAATLRVFATGRLVLWTTRTDLDLNDLNVLVKNTAVRKIAIAQPLTAPYGRAAQAALEAAGVWQFAQAKLVFGESIAQTAQFVETGNADVGFIALSLVLSPRMKNQGRWQEVPVERYGAVSLDHAAVLTKRGAANPAARRYLEFLSSDAAKRVLRDFGYADAPAP